MNTMQLECFLTVAETLNFARAARQLHVTQPAVTQQIHSLESELNVKLFKRTTRTVELTQAGLIFLDDAAAMLDISQRAKKRAQYSLDDAREPFVIGCHSHDDIIRLTKSLKEMKTQFPDFYPVFQVIPFQHLYQRLSEESVDVVIAFREGIQRKSIKYEELTRIRLIGIVDDNHPLADTEAICLDDLQNYPVISLNPQKCPHDYKKLMTPIMEDKSPSNVYFCDSVQASVALALAGYGIALLPDFLQNSSFPIKRRPIIDTQYMSYGIHYKTVSGHPRLKTFIETTRRIFL